MINEYVVLGVLKNGVRVWDGRGFTGDKSQAKIYKSVWSANNQVEKLFAKKHRYIPLGYVKFIIRQPFDLGGIESLPGKDHLILGREDE